VHSCAHALSTVADLHHGLANGIMLDHVMRFNLSAATAKMAEMARVVGIAGGAGGERGGAGTGAGVAGMSDADAAEAFIQWLVALKAKLGIPARLGEVGVKPSQVEALTAIAIDDICHQTNPRSCTRDDFTRIFAGAI
jgi:alcohol dehydrogenase class IV